MQLGSDDDDDESDNDDDDDMFRMYHIQMVEQVKAFVINTSWH